MKIVAILQARLGSSRLPEKVLAELHGMPMLRAILQRLKPAQTLDELVVATTTEPRDRRICELAEQEQVPSFRGSEADCLDRYYQAAKEHHADLVVRLTSDNPIVDAAFVDEVVRVYLDSDPPCDYVDTSCSKTYPLGLSVEVFSFAALATAWKEDTDPGRREHVTPYLYRNPERFRCRHLRSTVNQGHIRLTVDTAADLQLMQRIYDSLGGHRFAWQEAVTLVEQHPEWTAVNRHIVQKEVV
jgi:spore coat polysaccharide biosynthesis protein SpsF